MILGQLSLVQNLGPGENYSVEEILQNFKISYKKLRWHSQKKHKFKETHLLNLNCFKAKKLLNWQSQYNFKKTMSKTIYWYKNYLKKGIKEITFKQIKEYFDGR